MKRTPKAIDQKNAGIDTELFLAIQKQASALHEQVMELLRPHQLSSSQYNILRILRGAGDEGCTCSEIGERMITKDPDITRLLDRLLSRELIERTRSQSDRRVVKSFITKAGKNVLKKLDQPIGRLHQEQFSRFSGAQKKQLLQLLEG